MRAGIVLAGFTSLPAADFIATAREAEARGYHTAWLGEVSGYDAIVMSTVVATHTERLVVANGVLPVQTRTPVILGMAAAALNHLAPGRFALGLGLSSKTIVEQWHGLSFSPARMPGRRHAQAFFTLAALPFRKSCTRPLASGALCTMSEIRVSVKKLWSAGCSLMRGSACISA